MQVDIDILVYAVIAALLLGRLWAVLGTRNEDDPQRPNPFVHPPEMPSEEAEPAQAPNGLLPRFQPPPPPPSSLAGGLAQVASIDASFDEKQFLQESRDIFSAVVGAYAAGNLVVVADFLSPPLMAHFQKAVDVRTAERQTAQTKLARIKEAEVIAARGEDKTVFVTVRFVSDQENVLRDAGGSVIGGAEGKFEEVTDAWTFAKDMQTPAPRWVVVETKG